MAQALLQIDLDAIVANWRALDAASGASVATAAVSKADSYGLGAGRVAPALARAGARTFFVASTEEAASLRNALGHGPEIFVFSGHMAGDAGLIAGADLVPLLNSADQLVRHRTALPGHPYGIQLDSGMNRLGMEPAEWRGLRDGILAENPRLLMSHLACADEPDHAMNAAQLAIFRDMTEGTGISRSLAATGGILLGPDYHFDLTRPGIGLYGGLPFAKAAPVVRLSLPVIQVREVAPKETVGYGNAWTCENGAKIATVSAGYADGLLRSMSHKATFHAGSFACPIVGRVSMDLIGVDVSALDEMPETLDILGPFQGVDDLAQAAGTIGYEILTSLGPRYRRDYLGGEA